MAKFEDITIDVKAKLDVDRKTAEACLKLVELYCNANSKDIIAHKTESGELEFEFADKPTVFINGEAGAYTKEAVEAIKDGLAKRNIREGCYG